MSKILIYTKEEFAPIEEVSYISDNMAFAAADFVLVQDKNHPNFYAILKNRWGITRKYIRSSDIAGFAEGNKLVKIKLFDKPEGEATNVSVEPAKQEIIVREEITNPLQRMEV